MQVPLPGFPVDETLRAAITNLEHRPAWASAYVEEAYQEWRQDDNRRRTDASLEIGNEGADHFASSRVAPDEQVTSEMVVAELLDTLPDHQREFIELIIIDGHSYVEAAELKTAAGEKTSPDAVRKTVKRALTQLRKKNPHLDPSGFGSSHA